MSTRFYYNQQDYIVQLNLMDDIATASAESAAGYAAAAEASADEAAASAAAAASLVENQIVDGQTVKAPSQNAVFDALAAKQPTIVAGTTSQYYRGDKTFQTLDKAAVGLSNVDNTSDASKPVSTAQAAADAATLASANSYADGLVVSMWDDRGNYDASVNTFPTTGGSGSAGAVKKNDIWTISVAGTLGGTPVAVRQFIRALSDAPGQTATSWAIGLANTDIDDSITDGITGRAPSQNAVFDALALKAPLASPSLTGTIGVENLTLNGAARRIRADFSNATIASRTLFQSSTTNGLTSIGTIPNGTSTNSSVLAYNGTDPDNSGLAGITINNGGVTLISSKSGTGTTVPLVVNVNSNEMMRYDSTTYNISMFGAAIEDNGTAYRTISLGSGSTGSAGTVVSFKDSSGNARGSIASNTGAGLQLQSAGAGLPMLFYMQGTERLRLPSGANVIQSDMTSTPQNLRLAFQTSVLNGATSLNLIPNGTNTQSTIVAHNTSDAANAGRLLLGVDSTTSFLQADNVGTGTAKPFQVRVGGITRFTMPVASNTMQVLGSDATLNNRFAFQDSTVNAASSLETIPNGTGGSSQHIVWNNSDRANSSYMLMRCNSTAALFSSYATGTGSVLPITFETNGIERMRIASSGVLRIGQSTTDDPAAAHIDGTTIGSLGAGTMIMRRAGQTPLHIARGDTSGTNIQFYTDNGSVVVAGNITSNGSSTAYNVSSDYRLKENAKPLEFGLDFIKQVQFLSWNWKVDGRRGEGVFAHKLQELENPVPDAVQGDKDAVREDGTPEYQSADYSKLVPRMGRAIQELSEKLDAALKRIEALEAA